MAPKKADNELGKGQKNPPKKIKPSKGKVTKTARSGLQFPVGRIQRHLREGRYASRIGTGAAVFMAGVLEYLSAEILELGGEVTAANKKARIVPRHLMVAIHRDAELSELLKNVTIPFAGVLPFIHQNLLPKSSKSSKNATLQESVDLGQIDETEAEQAEGTEVQSEQSKQ